MITNPLKAIKSAKKIYDALGESDGFVEATADDRSVLHDLCAAKLTACSLAALKMAKVGCSKDHKVALAQTLKDEIKAARNIGDVNEASALPKLLHTAVMKAITAKF